MQVSELLIPPSPVDWRLYDHEVMMGWKTSQESAARVREELTVLTHIVGSYNTAILDWNKLKRVAKYFGLSKLPGLVATLTEELKADREKKVVLFFETRDVGMALREQLKAYKPILLFKGTPDAQRAKRLKDFQTKGWCRVAVAQLQFMAHQHDLSAQEGWFVELTADPEINAACSRHLIMSRAQRLVLLAGTVDEALMRQRWAATVQLLEGVTT